MKQMMKRLLCAAFALCLLAVGCGQAETTALEAPVQSLADLAAASVWYCGELVDGFREGMALPDSFAFVVTALGQNSLPQLGVTPGLMTDTAAQRAWIEANFACEHATPMTMEPLTMEGYTGIRVTRVEQDGPEAPCTIVGLLYTADAPIYELGEGLTYTSDAAWLGAEARVTLRRDTRAACGWQVTSCVLADVPVMQADTAVRNVSEKAAADFAMSNMLEYVNAAEGFAVEYPAIFPDDVLREMPGEGIDALLADRTAWFYVRPAGEDAPMWDDWLIGLEKTAQGKQIETNAAAGLIIERRAELGQRSVHGYYFDEQGRMAWLVQLWWDEAAHPELEQLADHMINSLSVDGLGEG